MTGHCVPAEDVKTICKKCVHYEVPRCKAEPVRNKEVINVVTGEPAWVDILKQPAGGPYPHCSDINEKGSCAYYSPLDQEG